MSRRLAEIPISATCATLSWISAFGSLSLALQGVLAAGWGYIAFRRAAR